MRYVNRWKALAAGSLVAGAAVIAAPIGVRLLADEPAPAKAEPADKAQRLKDELEKMDRESRPLLPQGQFPLDGFNEQMQKQMQEALKQFQFQFQGPGFGGPMILNGIPQRPRNPRLGVQVTSPSPELVDQLDLPKDQGVVIQDVVPGSPAEKAGFKRHDILLEIGGKKVPVTLEGLVKLLDEFPADKPLDAKVVRKGRPEKITGLKLAKAEVAAAAPVFPVDPFAGVNPFGGLGGVSSMSVQVSNGEFTIKSTSNGQEFTVVGKVDGDAKTVTSVKVKDGDKNLSFDKLDAVPKEYRETVEKLLKSVK